MLFKNACAFELKEFSPNEEDMLSFLNEYKHTPIKESESESFGWAKATPGKDAPMALTIDGAHLIRFVVEKKSVPAKAIKKLVEDRIAARKEKEPDFVDSKKVRGELKDMVKSELLAKAIPSMTETLCYLDPANKLFVIDASTPSKVDRIISLLLKTFSGYIKITPKETSTTPVISITDWVREMSLPPYFNHDFECRIKGNDEENTTITFKNFDLADEALAGYLEAGMLVDSLRLYSELDDIYFAINSKMYISGIKFGEDYKSKVIDEQGDNEDDDAVIREIRSLQAEFIILKKTFAEFIPRIYKAIDETE